jgi:hypothetical protein
MGIDGATSIRHHAIVAAIEPAILPSILGGFVELALALAL